MEAGLWTLFFATLIGMTGLSIKEPKLYRKIAFVLACSCIAGAVFFFVFNGIVHEVYKGLVPYIDKSKLELATEKKNSFQVSMLVPLCLVVVWLYSIVCMLIANRIESSQG